MFSIFEQLDEIEEERLVEGYRSDKRIREVCISALNSICGTNFVHTQFVIHHHDNNHDNCAISNLRLIPKYAVKNKKLGQFVNGNSAIHQNNYTEHRNNNRNGSGIQTIHVENSLNSRNIVYTYYY